MHLDQFRSSEQNPLLPMWRHLGNHQLTDLLKKRDKRPKFYQLPNDGNKLFYVDNDIGTSSIPDLSLPSEDDEEEVISNNVWEHAIDILFKLSPLHPDGKSLRKWVKHQNMDDMEMFY